MASGVELATAYVSLVGETSKLKKDINAAFDEADKSSARAGKKIGENLSSGLGGTKNSAAKAGKDAAAEYERALKNSIRGERIGEMIGKPIGKGIGLAIKGGIGLAAVGATAAVGTLAASLTKGFTRLKNIDNAKFQLEALGNSAADVKKIMDNATKAVKGTAFGLDAAATTAATAVAAGVRPGEDLTAYLTNVADAAAIAQTSLDEMGSIFNKVQTNGSAMTDDLQMLADRGLPIFIWLQKQYGVTGEALKKMVEDGKVSSADFNRAISENLGGAAQKMGQSFEGSLQNLDAALGRIGASLLGVPFDQASGGLGAVTGALDKLNGWINANQAGLIDFWSALGKAAVFTAQSVLQGASDILEAVAGLAGGIGNVQGAMTKFSAWQADIRGDHELADQLREEAEGYFSWGENLQELSDKLADAATNAGTFYEKLDGWADKAKAAATVTSALGDSFVKVQDNKIIVQSNVTEKAAELEDLELKVQGLPNGEFEIIPGTPEAQKLIDAFLAKNNPTAPVPVPVEPAVAAADQVMNDFIARWSKAIITPGVAPGSGVPGQNPLGIMAGGTGASAGNNPLDVFAPTGANSTSGGLQPNAAALKGRYESFGYSNIGGYSGTVDQPWDEHQTGTAIDIPIPNGNGADGNRVVADALRQPGAKYAIWQQRIWYPDGRVEDMEDRGSPTENHMDHVHVRTYASGGAARGPGGPKSDLIPSMLSNGEHVWTAAEVDAVGGQSAMYAMRAAALAGQIPGFNGGGEVIPLGAWGRLYDHRSDPRNNQWATPSDKGGQVGKPWPNKVPPPGYKKGYEYAKPGPGNSIWIIQQPGDAVAGRGGRRGFAKKPPKKKPDFNDPFWRNRRGIWGAGFADGGEVNLYDSGGPWPSGTLGLNATGEDEWVLTPEQLEELRRQGIDPATVEHGQGGFGYRPGPSPDQLAELQPQGGDGAELMGGSRTEGYIPAAAGSTAVAGESFMSGLYGMGAEVINGIIDQAASAASSAAGMAASAFAPGSGGAAGGLISAAIGMGTQAAKRGVEYGAQMLGILTDSIIEQATPFGAPRLLTTDATGFMPQQALMEAATTSLEKAFQPQQPQGPEQPDQVPTTGATQQVSELEPGGAAPQVNTTIHATVKDVGELERTMADRRMLDTMQYRGRPGP